MRFLAEPGAFSLYGKAVTFTKIKWGFGFKACYFLSLSDHWAVDFTDFNLRENGSKADTFNHQMFLGIHGVACFLAL